jgi:hypothetical protein
MARLGSEFLTSNAGTAFPFCQNAAGLAYTADYMEYGRIPVQAVLDAVLIVPADITNAYLYSIEPVSGQYEFVFEDQSHATLLTATVDIPTLTNGYGVVALDSSTCAVKLVVGQEFVDYLQAMSSIVTFGLNLPFEPAVVEPRASKLESVQIYSTPTVPKYAQSYTGDVMLVAGYNTTVDTQDDGTTITAVAGSGQGIAPVAVHMECSGLVQRMSNLVPDPAGAVRIAAGECYEIVPIPGLNTIRIEGNCYACCTCADYVNVATAIANLMARTDAMRLELIDIHAEYSDALDHYHNDHIPTLHTLYAEAFAATGFSAVDRHGNPMGGATKDGNFTLKITCHGATKARNVEIELEPEGCELRGGIMTTAAGAWGVTPSMEYITLGAGDTANLVARVKSTGSAPPVAMKWTISWDMYGDRGTISETTEFTQP